MKPNEFWKLVEKHPWIPRILIGFTDQIGLFPRKPNVIAEYLSFSAIRERIGFISFRPWSSLDLMEMPYRMRKETENPQDLSTHAKGEAIFHLCCFHRLGSYGDFSDCISNEAKDNQSLNDLIKGAVASGGIVDAVVRVHEAMLIRDFPADIVMGKILNLEEDPTSYNYRHGYEIFLPPTGFSFSELRR